MAKKKRTYKDYEVGKSYRYSLIIEDESESEDDNNDDFEINEYGKDYLGQSAIHIRFHKAIKDVWFIYDSQANEGIFKCVYND